MVAILDDEEVMNFPINLVVDTYRRDKDIKITLRGLDKDRLYRLRFDVDSFGILFPSVYTPQDIGNEIIRERKILGDNVNEVYSVLPIDEEKAREFLLDRLTFIWGKVVKNKKLNRK